MVWILYIRDSDRGKEWLVRNGLHGHVQWLGWPRLESFHFARASDWRFLACAAKAQFHRNMCGWSDRWSEADGGTVLVLLCSLGCFSSSGQICSCEPLPGLMFKKNFRLSIGQPSSPILVVRNIFWLSIRKCKAKKINMWNMFHDILPLLGPYAVA